MAALRYNGSLPRGTDQFEPWKNRLSLLSYYMEWLGTLASAPSPSEVSAMSGLYGAIFDASSTEQLVAALSSPALPPKPSNAQAFSKRLSEQGMIYSGPGLLTANHIDTIFTEPNKALGLLQMALSPPKGTIAGLIAGAQSGGIDIVAQHQDHSNLQVNGSTDALGQFSLSGMGEGTWSITPRHQKLTFSPPSIQVTLQKNEQLTGFDFTSFTFGSNHVPLESQVLEGIVYTSSNGQQQMFGNLSLPTPSVVLSSTSYGPAQSLVGEIQTMTPSANQSLQASGYYPSFDLSQIESELLPENIKKGVTLFGIQGNLITSAANTQTQNSAVTTRLVGASQKSSSPSGLFSVYH
jgi:hypothetical protein